MAVLKLDHVSATFAHATQPILSDISFELAPQQFKVVLGASGSGKTTLLNLIAGFERVQSGSIRLNGEEVVGASRDRGVVFQDDVLLPWKNVEENVAFGLELAGVDQQTRLLRARALLKQVNLAGFEKRQIGALSGGQRQRVGLARALAAEPKILLMDEPFAALDAFTREQMQCLLLTIWHQNQTPVFLISHDIEEAVFLATELLIMKAHPGRIVERIDLDFSHRFVQGESARSIKSDPRFIEVREYVLNQIFIQNNQAQLAQV